MQSIVHKLPKGVMAFVALSFSSAMAGTSAMPDSSLGLTPFVKMFFGLIIVVSLIFIFAWLSRKMNLLQKFSSGYQIKNLATLSLGTREKVNLIEVGGKQILIGIAPGRVNQLHVFDENIEVDLQLLPENAETSFSNQFKKALGVKTSGSVEK